jgi:predicted MFS family arabinose efflux permease
VVPLAADLAEPKDRGRAVGIVMSGLLIGILAARTVAGFIANWLGWRMVFRFAAGMMVVSGMLVAWRFPVSRPRAGGITYRQSLASLWPLFRNNPQLASASLTGAALFAAFSGFWTSLTFLLRGSPFHFSPEIIGLFGLVGIGGASVAPLAGRLADRQDPRITVTWALCGSGLALVWMLVAPHAVWALVVGIVLLDMSTQSGQISNQSRIYALSQTARSRMNTVYMVCYFVGGSLGSGVVSLAWGWGKWTAAVAVGLGFLALGGTAHGLAYRRASRPSPKPPQVRP